MPESIFNLKIFQWIEKNTIEEIVLNADEKTFQAWELLFIQGSPSNWEAYIIKSWEVKIIINNKEIARLKSWDIVWEIALLNEEERTATVEAVTNTEVIVLTIDSLIEMISNDNNTINNTIIERIEQNLSNE